MEAPTMAGYGSATDVAPQDAYRPLLGASWPELARRYLQEHTVLTISQDAVDAVVRLKVGAPGKTLIKCSPCSAILRGIAFGCVTLLQDRGAVEVIVSRHAVGVFFGLTAGIP